MIWLLLRLVTEENKEEVEVLLLTLCLSQWHPVCDRQTDDLSRWPSSAFSLHDYASAPDEGPGRLRFVAHFTVRLAELLLLLGVGASFSRSHRRRSSPLQTPRCSLLLRARQSRVCPTLVRVGETPIFVREGLLLGDWCKLSQVLCFWQTGS